MAMAAFDSLKDFRAGLAWAALAVLLATGCGDKSASRVQVFTLPPTLDLVQFDTPVKTDQALPVLDEALDRWHLPRRPGLVDSEIADIERRLPCPLPPLLKDMYRWRNGQEAMPFMDGTWLPLGKVRTELDMIRKVEADVALPPEVWFPANLLPIGRVNGQVHVAIECGPGTQGRLVIWDVVDAVARPQFRGLGHWLSFAQVAARNGAWMPYLEGIEARPYAEHEAMLAAASDSERAAFERNFQLVSEALQSNKRGLIRQALGTLHDRRLAPQLRTLLQHDDEHVASKAAMELGMLGDPADQSLLSAALHHDSAMVRNLAGVALRYANNPLQPHTVDAVLKALDDKAMMVRLSAVEALALAPADRAVPVLLQRLDTETPGVVQSIVHTLGALGDARALPALRARQARLAAMDLSKPDRGGTRGYDPAPVLQKRAVDEAIARIEGK
jgi:cell wall assembly regulator SMI1